MNCTVKTTVPSLPVHGALLGPILIFLSINSAAAQESPADRFAQYLKKPNSISVLEWEGKISQTLIDADHDAALSYDKLLVDYTQVMKILSSAYPQGLFSLQPGQVLERYSGVRRLRFYPIAYAPLLLITPPVYNNKEIRYQKLVISYQGASVYGLRVNTGLHPIVKKQPEVLNRLAYTNDLNARIAGFTHGRLMLALSKNVLPAQKFEYISMRPWSQHRRYKRYDQANKALLLTNYAHDIGDKFLISDHPDFALEIKNFDTDAVQMTFFLWRSSAQPLKTLTPINRVPDFVFQIFFSPESY